MECWHMSGAGNDFMVIDGRALGRTDYREMARSLCALSGADGFMAVDRSERGDFRLHFYNSDGSRGEMCGNGARCVCRFAYEKGIAGAEMTVETDAGLVSGWRLSETQYRVRLNDPSVIDLDRLPGTAYVELGSPGVPHALTELPDLTWDMGEALRARAKALRFDPAFPKGANVSFYAWLGADRVRVLTYERGVEDYTLACGTGCGSLAAALWTAGRLPGGRLTAENRGGELLVDIQGEKGCIASVLLAGPAEILKKYEV